MQLPLILQSILCMLALLASSAFACTIRFVYSDIATPPYQLGDGEVVPAKPGVGVELVNEAASRIGCQIDWRRVPNRRVHLELERGETDATLGFSYSEERTAYAVYPMKQGAPDPSFSVATLSYFVYVRDDSTLTWDGKRFSQNNLGAQPMGVNAGYSAAQDLRKLGMAVEEAPSTENNLLKLKSGRIGAYVMQDFPADLLIRQNGLQGVVKLPIPFSSKEYYVPFSKKFFQTSPDIANKLWKQIAEVRKAHGKELLRKYGDVN